MSEQIWIERLAPCECCGKPAGRLSYRELGWPWRVAASEGREPFLEVVCDCARVPCARCGGPTHQVGRSFVDLERGRIVSEPMLAAHFGCASCRAGVESFLKGVPASQEHRAAFDAARAGWPHVARPWLHDRDWKRESLVYGQDFESLLFLDEDEAWNRLALLEVLEVAKTWGEFRRRVHAREYAFVLGSIVNRYEIDDTQVRAFARKERISRREAARELYELPYRFPPEPDESFSVDLIPRCPNGDPYVSILKADMFGWVPEDIQERFGHPGSQSPMFDIDTLELEAEHEDAIVAAFAERGVRCRREQLLVSALGV